MSDLEELLQEIVDGRYSPRPGTAGELLIESASDPCRSAALQSLALFAKLATRFEGLCWPMWLDSDPDSLSTAEIAWVANSWQSWTAGASPWKRGTRRVPA